LSGARYLFKFHFIQCYRLRIYGKVRIGYKNSSGDEIANVNFFYNIAHVEAIAYAY